MSCCIVAWSATGTGFFGVGSPALIAKHETVVGELQQV
jgi:hypothetical protein